LGRRPLSAAPPDFTNQLFRAIEKSWDANGRTGRPRLVAQVNVAIGPEPTVADARKNILSYYDFLGEHAIRMAEGLVTTDSGIRDALKSFGDIGADEVMLYCWSTDPGQVDRIADITA
jgi:hypothetical protein